MKKCLHCGEMCEDNISICPKCGALVEEYVDHKTYMDVYHVNHGKKIRNYKLILWFLLGMILPYIGFLVSWIMYDGEREKAKAVLMGAIVSSLISMILPYLLIWVFGSDDSSNDSNKKGQQIKCLIEMYKNI